MAHRRLLRMTQVEAGPASQVVQRYLETLAEQLHGPARAKAAVIDEIGSGIDEAITAHTARGMTVADASEKAIRQLGSPRVIAAAFAGELAVRQARKTLWLLLFTGPFVGIWWFLLLATPSEPIRPAAIITAIPVLPAVATVLAIAAVVLATTGSLIRWLPESSPHRAALATGLIGLGTLAIDATMLAILATRLLDGTAESLSPTLGAIAATASVARVPFAGAVAWRCLRMPPAR